MNLNSLAWQLQGTLRMTEMPSLLCQAVSVFNFVSPC